MKKIDLNGKWSTQFSDGRKIMTDVPSCWESYIEEKAMADRVIFTKSFELEAFDDKKSAFVYFEAVSYYCDVFINGVLVGSHEGMWDSFHLDITTQIKTGVNTVELHIWKPGYEKEDRFPLREVLSGFIPDVLHTFGGIWGDVFIEITDSFVVTNHNAKGNLKGECEFTVDLISTEKSQLEIKVNIYDSEGKKVGKLVKRAITTLGENSIKMVSKIDQPKLWNLENPYLYYYEINIQSPKQSERLVKKFGFREIKYDKSQILLNGKAVYLRGLLHWGYYDDIIIPRPQPETIFNEIANSKSYGFNLLKHCLYIPSKKYFELADEMGMLIWVELPLWLPEPSAQLENRVRREYPKLMKQLEGHPSICLVSLGCELDEKVSSSILEEMYHLAKTTSDCLVRDNSGSGECYEGLAVDYADFFDYHFYADAQNLEPLMENFTPSWRNYRPWIYGEYCDCDTMRDLKEVRADRNVDRLAWESGDKVKNPVSELKPDFYADRHDERMLKSGIREEFELIKALSYNHALLHRKTSLEQTRAFNEISGYNLTAIRDVPITSTGMFDDMMNPKFDYKAFRQFNDNVVLIPAWDLTRIWKGSDRVLCRERYNFFSGSHYSLHILLSNYSGENISNPNTKWELIDDDVCVFKGEAFVEKLFENSAVSEVAYLNFNIPFTDKPKTLILKVETSFEGGIVSNSWPIFVYPKPEKVNVKIGIYDPLNIFEGIEDLFENIIDLKDDSQVISHNMVDMVFTSHYNSFIKRYLEEGGKVFCVQRGKGSLPTTQIAFWREGMIRTYQAHPICEKLEYKSWMEDSRWFSLGTDTSINTDEMEQMGFENYQPIVKRYDCRQWISSDYLAQYKLGAGTIVASTLRFEGGMGKQPAYLNNNCLGIYLLSEIVEFLKNIGD